MVKVLFLEEVCDFIIVGAGTAGLVVARRLSENPNIKILVLEAGNDRNDDPRAKTPALFSSLVGDPEFDWKFITEPQQNLNGRMVGHPRGRLLGGSSAINAEALVYPSKRSIDDAWAMLDYPEWGWDKIVAYYQKFHTLAAPSHSVSQLLGLDYLDDKIQGKTGPFQASFPDRYRPIQKPWVITFRNLNLHMTGDPLTREAIRTFSNPCTITKILRNAVSHAGSAYYAPVEGHESSPCNWSSRGEDSA